MRGLDGSDLDVAPITSTHIALSSPCLAARKAENGNLTVCPEQRGNG